MSTLATHKGLRFRHYCTLSSSMGYMQNFSALGWEFLSMAEEFRYCCMPTTLCSLPRLLPNCALCSG